MKREWVRINRKSFGMPDIFLRNATVKSDTIKNMVIVSGDQEIEVETRIYSELPKKTIETELSRWDPRRLIGIKTKKIQIPNEDGWKWDGVTVNNMRAELQFVKTEWKPKTYRINSVWIEMSSEE